MKAIDDRKNPGPEAPAAFHVMIKPCGASCNMACAYCFYRSKAELYPESKLRMPETVLEEFTRQYMEAQGVPEVTFAWQGGEPTLMGVDFFERALRCQQKYAGSNMAVKNTLQTNGLLLDDNWCRFLERNDFLVGVSLDGPAHMHDAMRVDVHGQPTFDRVMRGLELLRRHDVEFNILCCLHSANADYPLDVYRFLRDEAGCRFMQFIPVVAFDGPRGGQVSDSVKSYAVDGGQYGRFMIEVFKDWVSRDVGRVFVQSFDTALAAWVRHPPTVCATSPICGNALVLEHNGDVYSCDHFVEPDFLLGNIRVRTLKEMAGCRQQHSFGLAKHALLPEVCRECSMLFACYGGCPKDRVRIRGRDGKALNYLCSGYRKFFDHVDKPMSIMAALLRQGRAPAEIMQLEWRDDK